MEMCQSENMGTMYSIVVKDKTFNIVLKLVADPCYARKVSRGRPYPPDQQRRSPIHAKVKVDC